MKKKKALLTAGITLASTSAIIAGIALISKYTHPQLDAIKEIGQYELIKGPNETDFANHYASEFAYASYYDSRPTYSSSTIFQPELKNQSNKENKFWSYQLEISYDYKDSSVEEYKARHKPLFTLRHARTKAPIDVLKSTHNIYYHAYANDITGELFLNVLLEDKNSDEKILQKSTSDAERIDKWAFKTFKIGGFKKLDLNNQNELIRSKSNKNSTIIGSFGVNDTKKLTDTFATRSHGQDEQKVSINSVNDLIDTNVLPSIAQSEEAKIKANNDKVKSLLSISSYNRSNPLVSIDWDSPVYFTKSNHPDKLIMHYFVKRYVANATERKLSGLEQVKIKQEQTQIVYFNYFNLERIAKQFVEVIGKEGIQLNQYSQSGPNALSFSQNSSLSELNSSRGYFRELILRFKENSDFTTLANYSNLSAQETNLNNYTLYFETDKYFKIHDDANKDSDPYIGNQNADTINFAYTLKFNENGSSNGINKYYGSFKLSGFKPLA
ncbi:MAG1430 family protein [Mycoplasma simbae]|uniref:MAG1430 family protein n=1 Tax=Mycoplasma simbae TaxID=36744 RepID=UPI000495B452|nr:hypothetical protein [Mycoplasma simbae]